MKGISLMEPFGSFCVDGIKEFETRVRKSSAALTKYRGDLLICTSMKVHSYYESWEGFGFPDETFKSTMYNLMEQNALKADGIIKGKPYEFIAPLGHIIGMVKLVGIGDMEEEHERGACVDVYDGARVMKFTNPMRLLNPIRLKGLTNGFHLGIFDIKVEKESLVFAA